MESHGFIMADYPSAVRAFGQPKCVEGVRHPNFWQWNIKDEKYQDM
jgi:hypothetical protein